MPYCENCGGELQPGERCAECRKETKAKIKIGGLVVGKAALIVICSLLVILTISGIVGVKAVRSHQAKESLNLGNTYLLEGNYEQAILAFSQAIKIEPRNIEARLGKAEALIGLNRVAEAEGVLNEALAIDPKVPEIYLRLCDLYLERGDIPEILTLLDRGYKKTKDSGIQELLHSYRERVSIVASSSSLYVNRPTNFRLVYEDDNLTVDLKADWSTDSADSSVIENSDGGADITASELGEVTVRAVYGSLNKEITVTCRERIAVSGSSNAGNSNNYGLAAYADGWIYYYQTVTEGNITTFNLNKMRSDGSKKQYVGWGSWNINIVDDWIYFSCRYRMRLDGTEVTDLSDNFGDFVTIRDGWIYYADLDDDGKLYRMRVDGSGQELLASDRCRSINLIEDWIYYAGYNSEGWGIYRIRTDGTDRERLRDGGGCLQIVDGEIYIGSGGMIFRVLSDWVHMEIVIDYESAKLSAFNIADGWIYYSSWEGGIFRVRLDGTDRQKLSNDKDVDRIVIVEDWIFFYRWDANDRKIYRMRLDGSDWEIVD